MCVYWGYIGWENIPISNVKIPNKFNSILNKDEELERDRDLFQGGWMGRPFWQKTTFNVTLLRLLGDKLDPSTSDKQPKTHYLIVTFLGQSYLDS